eukprot:TRINITY_DN38148_c0_g1_i1.p1 TRINITY_DN38148_c0_g1~~TRINITY_DN38148_c0_g1_i1.p1  ORF type:complete len:128 (-),score=36.55 TRINITY_DN38148_c0_g1_i1:194-577(-)
MIRRPPRSTLSSSSAASDVYKRQGINAEYGALATTAMKLAFRVLLFVCMLAALVVSAHAAPIADEWDEASDLVESKAHAPLPPCLDTADPEPGKNCLSADQDGKAVDEAASKPECFDVPNGSKEACT